MTVAVAGYGRAEHAAIDAWLRRDFLARYNGTLTEPLPADLLALLEAA